MVLTDLKMPDLNGIELLGEILKLEPAPLVVLMTAMAFWPDASVAQTAKIKVGRTIGASGFHIPTYVAMDRGLYKAEGLDAEFVNMTGGELVRERRQQARRGVGIGGWSELRDRDAGGSFLDRADGQPRKVGLAVAAHEA